MLTLISLCVMLLFGGSFGAQPKQDVETRCAWLPAAAETSARLFLGPPNHDGARMLAYLSGDSESVLVGLAVSPTYADPLRWRVVQGVSKQDVGATTDDWLHSASFGVAKGGAPVTALAFDKSVPLAKAALCVGEKDGSSLSCASLPPLIFEVNGTTSSENLRSLEVLDPAEDGAVGEVRLLAETANRLVLLRGSIASVDSWKANVLNTTARSDKHAFFSMLRAWTDSNVKTDVALVGFSF